MPPLSLYVHIPWCQRKCPYCDFNSHEWRGSRADSITASNGKRDADTSSHYPLQGLPESVYIDNLLDDLAASLPAVWGRPLHSVFIGGGTPSLFSGEAIDRLLSGIRALAALSPDAEVTLEANPGTAEQRRFADYRAAGVNRLSIGVQSFDDRKLTALGRIHSAREALDAVEMAKRAGFERINLDLMFGLPGQSPEDARADVDQAIALDVDHLSFYELTLEPNTAFYRHPPALPDDDERETMQAGLTEKLESAGFDRYEVSAFARRGKRSVHNLNYWSFGDYLGIGAGAHGKISSAAEQAIWRTHKIRHPRRYLDAERTPDRQAFGGESLSGGAAHASPVSQNPWLAGCAPVPIADTGLEFMMNALRLCDGFPMPLFQQHTGLSLDAWQAPIEQAITRGWLEQAGLTLRPTARGLRWLNDLLELFLPVKEPVRKYPLIPLVRQ